MSAEAIEKLIAQRVADALETYETNRNTRNGNGNGSGNQSDGESVKYATCTLLNGALTWWNSHVRTIGNDAAYDMSWKDTMKMITKAQEMRFRRSLKDKAKMYIWGLPDIIQGNVTSARTTRIQDTVKLANSLMD
nr:hypothetical protein [Tanacetum cinerariifolium]